jgi:malonate transporter MadL subunit
MWIIFGFGVVSFFYVIGQWIGMSIGAAIGVGNVGGVAFAMMGVVLLSNTKLWKDRVDDRIKNGIEIASALYLPVIVAMVFSTDVAGAFVAGPVAIVAGATAIVSGLLLVTPIAKIGGRVPTSRKKEGD